MKFGIAGTGHWAEATHARALQSHPDADVIGVWGRDAHKAESMAARLGVRGYEQLDMLLEDVDAVSIAVAPDAQPQLAIRAAHAGCHLLLEKPIALDVATAERVRAAIEDAGVRALVFFTLLWGPATAAWMARAASIDSLAGGEATILVSNYRDDSPYRDSVWRKSYGPVWDLGPHVLSVLVPLLGPVTASATRRGSGDIVYLDFSHESGAKSTCALSMSVDLSDIRFDASVWSDVETTSMSALPRAEELLIEGFRAAVAALVTSDPAELRGHPAGIDFGVDVVRILENTSLAQPKA